MKKHGSILIEVAASIMILTLTTTFIVSTSIKNIQVLKERILLEEVNRDVSNLINEFKYNLTKEEIEELLKDEKVGYKYYENFSEKLLNSPVNELENGNDIEVIKIGEDNIGIRFKVQTNIKNEKSEAVIEREFIKSWWMDET
ncbi:hypothetical protein [Clostridium sp. C2-6-12]|uniref:hypothetical protein n=1 Tax=Clostridium sp. C2-6-12 TaxID=2698832 RepID=UPI00136E61F5|nr:hypothetical protein [Clostridium sp. C2-6-12]